MALLRRWILAARPKTLTAAVAPVVVGGAVAEHDGEFAWDVFLVALVAATAIQIGVNFANDLADARSGADTEQRIGPVRAVSAGLISPSAMRRGIAVAFAVACLAGAYLIAAAGWVVAVIGIVSLVAALAYTAGPWPYGYHGLGEVSVFVFFGLIATAGTRYLFDGRVPAAAWLCGATMGFLAAAILEANNVRDIDTDRTAAKRTLAVIVGRERAVAVYGATLSAAYVPVAVGVATGALPALCLLALASAPFAVPLVRTIAANHEGPALIGVLVGTARLELATAALLAAALVLA